MSGDRGQRYGLVALALALALAGCGAAPERPAPARAEGQGAAVARALIGLAPSSGPDLLKGVSRDGARLADEPFNRELTAVVGSLQAALARRPGVYIATVATILDNETLAKQNNNPDYGNLLARWGRETGYFVAFEHQGTVGDARLLRASIIISRYRAPAGARDAYRYVVEQQGRSARRFDLPAGGRGGAPWDEAVIFYQESADQGRATAGQFTLIFRAGRLIGFVTNLGLAGAVTTDDTAALTQALFERLDAFQ